MISLRFWFIFYFFVKVNFTRTRALVYFGLAFLEFIPVVDEFPLWTIDIIAVLMMVAAEDRMPFLRKLDRAAQTRGGRISNAAELKGMMSKSQQNALRRVSGAIMKRTGNDKEGRIPLPMNSERDQKIAEQRAKKADQSNEPRS